MDGGDICNTPAFRKSASTNKNSKNFANLGASDGAKYLEKNGSKAQWITTTRGVKVFQVTKKLLWLKGQSGKTTLRKQEEGSCKFPSLCLLVKIEASRSAFSLELEQIDPSAQDEGGMLESTP